MEAHTHTHTIASELENPAKMHCMEPKSLKDTTKESNDCSHTKWLNIWNQYSICKMKKRNIKPIWFGRVQYATQKKPTFQWHQQPKTNRKTNGFALFQSALLFCLSCFRVQYTQAKQRWERLAAIFSFHFCIYLLLFVYCQALKWSVWIFVFLLVENSET